MSQLPRHKTFDHNTGPKCVWCDEYLADALVTVDSATSDVQFDREIGLVWLGFDVDCQTCAKPNRLRFSWDMDDNTAEGIAEPLRTEKDMRMLTGNPHFEKPRP